MISFILSVFIFYNFCYTYRVILFWYIHIISSYFIRTFQFWFLTWGSLSFMIFFFFLFSFLFFAFFLNFLFTCLFVFFSSVHNKNKIENSSSYISLLLLWPNERTLDSCKACLAGPTISTMLIQINVSSPSPKLKLQALAFLDESNNWYNFFTYFFLLKLPIR